MLSNFANLSDWPFFRKVILAPSIALSILLITVIGTTAILYNQSEGTNEIVETQFIGSIELTNLVGRFRDVDGSVYRALTFQAAELENFEITTEFELIISKLVRLNKDIEEYRDSYGTQTDIEKLNKVIADINDYKGTVEVVASMMELDFNTAVSFVEPFKKNAEKLISSMRSIVELKVENSKSKANSIQQSAQIFVSVFVIIGFLSIVIILFLSIKIAKSITKSIDRIANVTMVLAEGDISIALDELNRKDELSAIVTSLRTFRDNLREQHELRKKTEQMSEEKTRDEALRVERERHIQEQAELRQKAEHHRIETIESLANRFENEIAEIVSNVGASAEELTYTANAMSSGATQTRDSSEIAASSSDMATENVNAVAVATEQLTMSVAAVDNTMDRTSEIAKRGLEATYRSTATLESLSSAAQNIGNVVSLINDIAEQTNLLALNATIEAARAGEVGKGFAVVASEVKNLAKQSSGATEEIANQVENIQNVVGEVVVSISEISEIIKEVNDASVEVSSTIKEQSAATNEISQNAHQASLRTRESQDNLETASAMAIDSENAAQDVLTASSELATQAANLGSQVHSFLGSIKAAE